MSGTNPDDGDRGSTAHWGATPPATAKTTTAPIPAPPKARRRLGPRDPLGNRHFVARRDFDEQRQGQRAIATFHDGEEIWGTMKSGEDEAPGFFLTPTDNQDNNIRIFI